MSSKIFKKFYARDYFGIGCEASPIDEGDEDFSVQQAVNYESAVADSLRGRVGCQAAAGPGYFFGLFPYNYTRTTDQYDIVYDAGNTISSTKTAADGASISKLIAINQQCWVRDTMNITITQTNAGTYTWWASVSGSTIGFNIAKDGTNILTASSLGDGIASNTSIYSLLGTIDALADLAVSRTTRGTCPPFAIVDSGGPATVTATLVAGSTYGTTYSIPVVNTPHNFYPGDIICFPQCTISGGTLNGVTTMAAGIVTARTATLITYMGPRVTVDNSAVLGYMGQSAVGFPITAASTETAGAFILSIPYWRYIPEGPNTEFSTTAASTDYGHLFTEAMYLAQNKTATSFFAPPVSVCSDNNLYIATSTRQPYIEALIAGNPAVVPAVNPRNGVTQALIKCDTQQLFRTGLSKPSSLGVSAAAGATLTGTYKYKMFIRRYDAQGNIIDGPLSSISTITYAAPNQTGLITAANWGYQGAVRVNGYQERSAYKVGNQASNVAGGFAIDDSAAAFPYFQIGDVCCFLDNTAQTTGLTNTTTAGVLGTLHVTRCTFVDGTGANLLISVADTSGATILDNSAISSGLTAVFLRTTAGGNQYYYLAEVPICNFAATIDLTDNVTDATLTAKAQYTEIEIGKEHDAPPNCSLVCTHQGGLVVARGFSYPNTVSFSTADGIEYMPIASNSFDVPSTLSGHVSAIASDTDDRLAVFKSRAYYDVVGDLDGGVFSVTVKNEGDYGIASQASLVRIKNSLIGVSMNGFITLHNGELNHLVFNDLNAKLINQPYNFQWATAVNDSFMRTYICTIPIPSATLYAPLGFVVDYDGEEIRTFERNYDLKIDQAAGACMVSDNLYHLSQLSPGCVFRRLERFNNSGGGPYSGSNLDGDSFIDNTSPIFYVLESKPITLGEPAQYKTPIRLRVFSLPNDFVLDGWQAFTMQVDTAAGWTRAFFGSTFPGGTTSTISFTGANTPFWKDIQLAHCKTFFYMVRFTTYTIRVSPFLTGYELMFAADYIKEDLPK